MRFLSKGLRLSATALALSAGAPGLRAQAAADASSQPDSLPLEAADDSDSQADPADPTITVTGYRGSTRSSTVFPDRPVLDTPFSINSLGAELLEDQQAISFTDVVRNDPSIVLAFPQYDDTINLRGFYQNLLFREGLPTSAQIRAPFQNKDRIDVFRGLAGFRFGFTSPGGVVNFAVKRPTDDWQGDLLLGGDEHGSVYGQLDVGGRFGSRGQFGVRANLFLHEIDSFRNNVTGDQQLYSILFEWRPSDALSFELDYERFDTANSVYGILFGSAFGSDVARAKAILPLIEPEMTSAQPWLIEERFQELLRLSANWTFAPGWTASLSGHMLDSDAPYRGNEAADIQADGTYTLQVYTIDEFEQRLDAINFTVNGSFELAGLRNDIAAGYIYDDRTGIFDGGYFFPDASAYLGGVRRANLFTGQTIDGFVPPPGSPGEFSGGFASTRHTAFLNNTLYLNDSLQLLAGITYARLRAFNPLTDVDTYEDEAFSPVLGALWKPGARTSAYLSYATGLEEGQTPPPTAANFSPEPFPPITSEQFELGIKHELARGALVTLALFQIDKGLAYVNSANLFVQDGVQRHRGVELNVVGQITPDLRLAGGVTYLDARIEEAAENVGNRIPGIGEWRYSLFADWRTPLDPDLYLTGGVQGDSAKFVTFANDFDLPGYTIFDLGARYEFDAGPARAIARLGVQNLFDERFYESIDFYGGIIFGAARTVRASLEFRF